MNKVTKVLFVIAFLFFTVLFFYSPVFAEEVTPITPLDPVAIHLSITTNDGELYDQDISVNACNNDNGATEEIKITGYCAILQSGIDSDWNWDWAPGAFLNSLGGIEGYTSKDGDGNDVYHYWSWYLNTNEATEALNQYELQSGDSILLNFIDPIETIEEIEDEIPPPAQETSSSSGGSRKKEIKKEFDLNKAFEFLLSQQKEDGSFEEELYTDWSAIALSSGNYQKETIKLIKYLVENKITSTLLTDYQRRAMSLMALGLNPYNTNGENYIEKITNSFDGKQFGDVNEYNDDIFALIVLTNTGYTVEDKMIIDAMSFILSKQKENGSWSDSVDMTGASIQALVNFSMIGEVGASLDKAKKFLKEKQEENGSFDGNVSSTAWVLQGLNALREDIEDWENDDKNPLDYLITEQNTDGGIKDNNIKNRIWKTSYVISALSGKSWNELMQKFERQENKIATPEQKIETKKVVQTKKTETIQIQNKAKVIDSIEEVIETKTENKNWFLKLISKIFSVF